MEGDTLGPSLTPTTPWADLTPRLVKHGSGWRIESKLTALLDGLPPILVAGMTPCTVSAEFVSSINDAGFHAELAAGGLPTASMFEKRITQLATLTTHCRIPIAINLLFLNPTQWAFQWPLVQQLLGRGLPIGSITVAAGVPSPDKADELLAIAHAKGLKFVAFKPGSASAIRQVIEIAQVAHHPLSCTHHITHSCHIDEECMN